MKFGGDDVTPDALETLAFWRSVNNKEVTEGWRERTETSERF